MRRRRRRRTALAHIDEAQASIAEAREALAALAQASSDALGKADRAKSALGQAKEDVATLSLALSDAAGITASANTQLVKFSTSMGSVLDEGSLASPRAPPPQTNDAIGKAAASVTASQGEVDAAIARGQAVVQENEQVLAQLEKALGSMPDGQPGKQELAGLISQLQQSNADSGRRSRA